MSSTSLSLGRRVLGTTALGLFIVILLIISQLTTKSKWWLLALLSLLPIFILAFFVIRYARRSESFDLGAELPLPVVAIRRTRAPDTTVTSLLRTCLSLPTPSAQGLYTIASRYITVFDRTLSRSYLFNNAFNHLVDVRLSPSPEARPRIVAVLNGLREREAVVTTLQRRASPLEPGLAPDPRRTGWSQVLIYLVERIVLLTQSRCHSSARARSHSRGPKIINHAEWRGKPCHDVTTAVARGRATIAIPQFIDASISTPSLSSDGGNLSSTTSSWPTPTRSTPPTSIDLQPDHQWEAGTPNSTFDATIQPPNDEQVLDTEAIAQEAPEAKVEETVAWWRQSVPFKDVQGSRRIRHCRRIFGCNASKSPTDEDWKWAKTEGKNPVGGRRPLVITKLASPTTFVGALVAAQFEIYRAKPILRFEMYIYVAHTR